MPLTGGMNCAEVIESKAADKRKTQEPIFKSFPPNTFTQRRSSYVKFAAEAAAVYFVPASSLFYNRGNRKRPK